MTSVRAFSDLDGHDTVGSLDLLNCCEGLIGIYDKDERLRYANNAFCNAYFIEPGETLDWSTLMRRNFKARRGTIISTDDIESWISSVRSRRGKLHMRAYESDLHDGRWISVVETMRPDGAIIYIGTDVTALRQSERDLRHARDSALRDAQTDGLTGVSNRKHVTERLKSLTTDAREQNVIAGYVCLMDLDHFKAINDTHGHIVGDQVLVAFARAIRETVRLRDSFGRVGGEEFLLILPQVTLKDCHGIMNKIYARIRSQSLLPENPDLKVTFSAGLCPIMPHLAADPIYANADAALYKAKSTGRDRMVVASAAFS